MQHILAQMELPSSNRAEDIHRFVTEVNRLLDPEQGVHVVIEWRSNRRFLQVQRVAGR
ncbi:MAG: hypothetical protein HY689_13300 [Chloroflexi bacterium]|nr:hypothetical protein [Chloroflexota bacterium]